MHKIIIVGGIVLSLALLTTSCSGDDNTAATAGGGTAGVAGASATGGQAMAGGGGATTGGQGGAGGHRGGQGDPGAGGAAGTGATIEITFDDLTLPDQPTAYQHVGLSAEPAASSTQTFTSQFGVFSNSYDPQWGSWNGFSYSRDTDTTTSGYTNQFSAITGGGAAGSVYYAVAYDLGAGTTVQFAGSADGYQLTGAFVTNTTYAYLAMRDGDAFAKKFGGTGGTDPDWFRLDIVGVRSDLTKTAPVQFYLADFRSADSAGDYILNEWRWVDLTGLGQVIGLEFTLSSTDSGTPYYFALDSIRAIAP
jgi:hypothetical protein